MTGLSLYETVFLDVFLVFFETVPLFFLKIRRVSRDGRIEIYKFLLTDRVDYVPFGDYSNFPTVDTESSRFRGSIKFGSYFPVKYCCALLVLTVNCSVPCSMKRRHVIGSPVVQLYPDRRNSHGSLGGMYEKFPYGKTLPKSTTSHRSVPDLSRESRW